ncbi:hypothetical protein AAFF_G00168010 [Aldrovandia affinis]|uniref:PH domain-containing protein n=1 Tax=Aldrovandia affinis TaxID=143900 RepID=A0AAD7W7X7_9TELE|nr:hypothetical protein AAFF_G00168010 [Aldrovandia affinis]
MDLKSELLKSIWYAFTSLDVEQSGKVSKSQLKVLSHNLYTALNIPHDPVALEEHFQDDDDGPVSRQGYMPYLNKYILAKAKEGTFNKETFDDLCWMMTAKKNHRPSVVEGVCSRQDCFKLFCLFNLLSEDHYPLVMIPAEVEYLMKKISMAMSHEWDPKLLEDLLCHDPSLREGLSIWVLLEHMNNGTLLRVTNTEAFSLALDEVFQEMYHNVLKKGYMWKKGHVRRNWTERWFVLKPSTISYYVSEDLKEKKGEILLDKNSVVEAISDKEGKRCLFCVKAPSRTYEMSASDLKQRIEWIQATQTALRLLKEEKASLHQELKLRRREQRDTSLRSREVGGEDNPQERRDEKERQEQEIESIIQLQREVEAQRRQVEEQEKEQQMEVQLERQLQAAEKMRESMEVEMAQKEKEAEEQRKRIQELEITQRKLEGALSTEIQARLEEEKARLEEERLQQEEEEKVKLLRLLQQEQATHPQEVEQETQSSCTEQQQISSTSALDTASLELQSLRETRERSNQHLEEAKEKLRDASRHVKHWNVRLNRLMKPVTPGDRFEDRQSVKQSKGNPDGAFTSREFIAKYQPGVSQESHHSNSQSSDERDLQEQLEASRLPPRTVSSAELLLESEAEEPALQPVKRSGDCSVLLFPGQGSQFVGMGRGLLKYGNVKEMFHAAHEILGYDLLSLCLNGPEEDLMKTVHCQPAVFVTSLAAVERLNHEVPAAIEGCVAAAGFSVGELF